MTNQHIDFTRPALNSFYRGADVKSIVKHVIDEVESMVTSTMGPNGRLAVISYGTEPKTTKDGVTVARSIKFNNEACEYINRILTEAAVKTDEECGDGTTTTIFLTKCLFEMMNKYNTFVHHQQIETLVGKMVELLSGMSFIPDRNSSQLYQLALTSSNNDKSIADIITKIYADSPDGYPQVQVKEGFSADDIVSSSEGLPLAFHFANAAFSLRGMGEVSRYDAFYVVALDSIVDIYPGQEKDAVEALKSLAEKYNDKPIFILTRSAEMNFCNACIQINRTLSSQLIPMATGFGGSVGTLLMGDILSVVNGVFSTSVEELKDIELTLCTETVEVGTDRAILKSCGDETQQRIDNRVAEVENALAGMNNGDRYSVRVRAMERRIRDLKGELVTILVGGETQSEVRERADRFTDVDKAVRSALENGILPGSGSALRSLPGMLMPYVEANLSSFDLSLVNDLMRICYEQYRRLFNDMGLFDDKQFRFKLANNLFHIIDKEHGDYINLATGERGYPSTTGVYDTAYAAITALKGGLKTAKILAQTDTILLGSKLGARQF